MDRILQAARKPEFVFTWTGATNEAIDWSFYLVAGIWWIKELSLSPIQLVSLGVVVQITIVSMEVPTGVISDLLSRKLTIVLSRFLMGASFFLVVASRNCWLLLPAQVLGGVSWTLRSGADVAWLSDELGIANGFNEQDLSAEVQRVLLRKHRLGMALASVGIVAAVLVGLRSLELAIQLTGVEYFVLVLVTMIFMTERGFEGGREHGKTFVSIFREGSQVVRSRPRLCLSSGWHVVCWRYIGLPRS